MRGLFAALMTACLWCWPTGSIGAATALAASAKGSAPSDDPSASGGKPVRAKQRPASGPASANAIAPEFATADAMLLWLDRYHLEPTPDRLADAVRNMVRLGLLRDPEKSGMFVGFMAGVLGDNPRQAEKLILKMFPIPPDDQGTLIMAVAYSDLAEWRDVMKRTMIERMPARQLLLRKHLYGNHVPLLKMPLDAGPELLDTLWGNYLATGRIEPVLRMLTALPWSKEKKDVTRLTIGGVAKWTLATNASHDKGLLEELRRALPNQPKDVAEPLREVIKSAENFETHKIRKEMVEAIEDLKRRGPQPDGTWAKAANIGSVAIAIGCVAASVTGHVELGIPCVLTGAAASGASKLLGP